MSVPTNSHFMLTWDDFVRNHCDDELLSLLEEGDDITIDGEHFSIIAASTDGKCVWTKPHEGYLGDRAFPIETVTRGLSEELIIERRLNKLKLEEDNNE